MTMIERVARAICAAEDYDWESLLGAQESAYRQQKYMRFARAAIEAMWEPTEKMAEAGSTGPFSRNPDSLVNAMFFPKEHTPYVYRAMIDAALKEESNEPTSS